MRFRENGADIPAELLNAVSNGDTIFLCGAGVSKRAGLPLFDELTAQIYDAIGERRVYVAAERRAFDRAEYDRALRSLEKRTLLPRAPSRVRSAVSELLQPRQGVELADHLALVQLSRDAEGRPKVLTTNFDTLFERAARNGGFNAVPSHAGKAIPKPGGPNDQGILHLHGRLADATLGLLETDLVLTSADFGDAYLRDNKRMAGSSAAYPTRTSVLSRIRSSTYWDAQPQRHLGLYRIDGGRRLRRAIGEDACCARSGQYPGCSNDDPKHALGLVQYLRTIGYSAWIEDTNGNEIDEKALKMAIRSRHEEAPVS
jgi:hypothetical protein